MLDLLTDAPARDFSGGYGGSGDKVAHLVDLLEDGHVKRQLSGRKPRKGNPTGPLLLRTYKDFAFSPGLTSLNVRAG